MLVTMKIPPPSPAQILAQIAQIQSMELGKLCEYRHAARSPQAGSYFKLQRWQDGKNHTRHVRPEELPTVREAIEGYARFRQLTDQYVQRIVAQTRARLAQDVKKKLQSYSPHSRKKSKPCSSRS